jgi:hypothetical protein
MAVKADRYNAKALVNRANYIFRSETKEAHATHINTQTHAHSHTHTHTH